MTECKQANRGDDLHERRQVAAPLAGSDALAGVPAKGAAMRSGRWWRHARAACMAGAASVALGGCAVFVTHPLRADATLRPTPGHTARGTVALTQRPEGVQVTYDIVGLTPNTAHAFALHQGGDCGGPDAGHVGPRLELADIVPPGTALARQRESSGGVGLTRDAISPAWQDDALTRIWADATGTAVGFFVLPEMSLDGLRSIVGRTLVVHEGYVDRASLAEEQARQQAGDAAERSAAKRSGKPSGKKGAPSSGKRKPGDADLPGDSPDSVHLRWPVPPTKDPAGGVLACGVVHR
ncbi:superoxide dismutase family protein [Robbsia andropogonis]|uniref:superoxide dismutase family protein n=1 Tax=Robbsia andropogonis TaxID=28092 RepID=UPI0004654B2C|nr:superoxide dismutase family protein [Robbsia andropogonis]MCP1116502.1 superoxide dismutase family protein [Robbsia andropogonis]MCP1126819.1 superoxide dismutase family protein [Robbsia andropogonis]